MKLGKMRAGHRLVSTRRQRGARPDSSSSSVRNNSLAASTEAASGRSPTVDVRRRSSKAASCFSASERPLKQLKELSNGGRHPGLPRNLLTPVIILADALLNLEFTQSARVPMPTACGGHEPEHAHAKAWRRVTRRCRSLRSERGEFIHAVSLRSAGSPGPSPRPNETRIDRRPAQRSPDAMTPEGEFDTGSTPVLNPHCRWKYTL